MDVIVTPADGGKTWNLVDLLGRSMGRIEERTKGKFTIDPEGQAEKTFDMPLEAYPSLDAALAAIEKHTRGVCRLAPGVWAHETRSVESDG